jgi:hypothetical protein
MWDINLNIQGAPLPSRAIFPINFCMLHAWKNLHLEVQFVSSMVLTCSRNSSVMPTVILFVSTDKPSTICTGPTIISNHFSKERGHCLTSIYGSPQTVKIASIVAARRFNM